MATTNQLERIQAELAIAQAALDQAQALVAELETEPPAELTPRDPHAPQLDRRRFSVRFDHKELALGNTRHFAILEFLARRPGWYSTRAELLKAVWGANMVITDNAVTQAVSRLRGLLREGDMATLANAVDGDQAAHYTLHAVWKNVTETSPEHEPLCQHAVVD